MNKKIIYLDILVSLSILVPSPGRFACGLILVVEMNTLIASGIFAQYMIKKLGLEQLRSVILMTFFLCMAIIMKLLLVFLSPVLALQLGFVMYLPALSSYVIDYFFSSASSLRPQEGRKKLAMHCAGFSVFALFFFLFRDIVGYGTLTLPIHSGMKEIIVCNPANYSSVVFIATIPGALILSTLILWFTRYVHDKFYCIENTYSESEEEDINV